MTCLASTVRVAVESGVFYPRLTKTSTPIFRKVCGEGNVSASPRPLGPGRQVSKPPSLAKTEPRVKIPPRPPTFMIKSLTISQLCGVYSSKDSYIPDSVSVPFQSRGGAIHGRNARISTAKPFFLLLAWRHAISSNMLGQGVYIS